MNNKSVDIDPTSLVPFIKWAGGKRWLWKNYAEHFPARFGRYFEPFLGGGAIFLSLRPSAGVLSDLNGELINAYRAIKKDWRTVAIGLKRHQRLHSEQHYYTVRRQLPTDLAEQAVRFLYLNRTCWNGLYRVNLAGQFNVPKGTKDAVLLATDDLEETSVRLKGMNLLDGDFEAALSTVRKQDFVYIDPPYTVKHNVNGFLKYNEKIFSWQDQERLAKCVERLAKTGSKVLVSQADHVSIRQLYSGIGSQLVVGRSSIIAADPAKRLAVTELLIRINY